MRLPAAIPLHNGSPRAASLTADEHKRSKRVAPLFHPSRGDSLEAAKSAQSLRERHYRPQQCESDDAWDAYARFESDNWAAFSSSVSARSKLPLEHHAWGHESIRDQLPQDQRAPNHPKAAAEG